VINTNLQPILHRFRDTDFGTSKIVTASFLVAYQNLTGRVW